MDAEWEPFVRYFPAKDERNPLGVKMALYYGANGHIAKTTSAVAALKQCKKTVHDS